MGSVPIATIEYPDSVVTNGRQGLEEAYEAALVIELSRSAWTVKIR